MDSYVYGINTSSESIITFRAINMFLSNFGTPVLREKRENFLTSNLYHKRSWNASPIFFYSLPASIVFNIQPDVEHWIVW